MWNIFSNSKKNKSLHGNDYNSANKKDEVTQTHKSFSNQDPEEMEVTLKEGAKLFSRDFTRTIELLANE